jgi:hypothetical protein
MASVYNPLSNKDEVVNLKRILVDNESTYSRLSKEMRDKCKRFEDRCKRLEYERNYYMSDYYKNYEGRAYSDLFKKYVGLYSVKDKSLIIHHSIDTVSNYPYGNPEEYVTPSKVKGSWDNWTKEYELRKKTTRNSSGIYEGIVYYITLDEDLRIGNEYNYKFKDNDGNWIEPVNYDSEYDDYNDINSFIDYDMLLVDVKRDESGIWNAIFNARSYDENLGQ